MSTSSGLGSQVSVVEGVAQCLPGERGALDPRRVFPHTRKHGELADLGWWCFAHGFCGEHGVDAGEEREGLVLSQPLDRHGHQRGGGLGDGASFAREGDIGDGTVGEAKVEGQLIATEWVDCFDRLGCILDFMEVSWISGMVDDHFLVEVRDAVTHRRTPMTAPELP